MGIDGHKAKVISVCIQQWKKGDVRLGSGRGDHVGSKLMVVKRKDWQALVSLAHRAREASMPNHRKTFGNEEDAASMRLTTALMTRAGGDVPDGGVEQIVELKGLWDCCRSAAERPMSAGEATAKEEEGAHATSDDEAICKAHVADAASGPQSGAQAAAWGASCCATAALMKSWGYSLWVCEQPRRSGRSVNKTSGSRSPASKLSSP